MNGTLRYNCHVITIRWWYTHYYYSQCSIPSCHGYMQNYTLCPMWLNMDGNDRCHFQAEEEKNLCATFLSLSSFGPSWLGTMEALCWYGWTNSSSGLDCFVITWRKPAKEDSLGYTVSFAWAKYTLIVLNPCGTGICQYHTTFYFSLSNKSGEHKDGSLYTKDSIVKLLK